MPSEQHANDYGRSRSPTRPVRFDNDDLEKVLKYRTRFRTLWMGFHSRQPPSKLSVQDQTLRKVKAFFLSGEQLSGPNEEIAVFLL